ncbi:FecR family protein [Olivibacter domesticus]|uniref:FecR family protein n=1 Tax=Olivibacter domesticus TaxID=407022 RepID=A0A1H7Q7K3_OLID1|nr:FecR domain-containing protein [Olivibacter domesticus]SEL44070.1 FecR family protein [Olivibacter domesticus]
MKEEISEALLKRYLDKTCSPEEASIVEDWYKSIGDNWSNSEMSALRKRDDIRLRMLQNIKHKSGISTSVAKSTATEIHKIRSNRYSIRLFMGVAALFLLVVAIVLFQGQLMNVLGISTKVVLVENKTKTIMKHKLPDGSIIWLNPKSTVEYSANFQQDGRELSMAGEIFFEIAKDKNRPFIISSGALTTKVLGTSFRIKTDEQAGEEVSVITGMVSVSQSQSQNLLEKALVQKESQTQEVLLVADQKVSFSKQKTKLVKAKETEDSSVGMWRRKNISFEDTPLKVIVDTLNNAFKVQIELNDTRLNNYTLTADFKQLNLLSIMEIMSQSLNLQYEVSGDRILLKKK